MNPGYYFAEFYVRIASQNYAMVALLKKIDLDPFNAGVDLPEFKVRFKGSDHRFSFARRSDQQIMKGEFESKI